MFTEDGSCLGSSEDSEEVQTIGAAVASIFIEFRAAEGAGTGGAGAGTVGGGLESLVYRTERRLVCCQQVASLSDGMAVLLVVSGREGLEAGYLQKVTRRGVEDLSVLKETFAGMTKRFNE